MMNQWIPVRAAARLLRVQPQRVYQLIQEGRLGARRIERTWLVSMESVRTRLEKLSGVHKDGSV